MPRAMNPRTYLTWGVIWFRLKHLFDPIVLPEPEELLEPFKVGDWVIYEGNTYSFPGKVCGITDDGQYNVRAIGFPDQFGYYRGMKHIFGRKQLKKWNPPPRYAFIVDKESK